MKIPNWIFNRRKKVPEVPFRHSDGVLPGWKLEWLLVSERELPSDAEQEEVSHDEA